MKTRRTVEIYFVLYLAAIVFLLPDKNSIPPEMGAGDEANTIYPYKLELDRNVLTCKMVNDSLGLRILSIDSANTIVCTGDIEDIDYEFTIIDNSKKISHKLTSNDRPMRHFRIEENPDDPSTATFFWIPPENLRSEKVYQVKVTAKITPKDSDNIANNNEELTDNTIELEARFSLNVIFVNSPTDTEKIDIAANTDDSARNINYIEQRIIRTDDIYTGDFEFHFDNYEVKELAGEKWKNTLIAHNINLAKGLKGIPKIKVYLDNPKSGGTAQIINDKYFDRMILSGRTPWSGKMKVEVTLIRKSDNMELTQSFTVQPMTVGQPVYPKEMYPGIAYRFDPRLPVSEQEAYAYLKDGTEILYKSEGSAFQYEPGEADIGKTLILERFVGGETARYNIKVIDFGPPVITDFNEAGGKVHVEILSYGKGRTNEVVDFEVSGNAVFKDLRGYCKKIDKITTKQIFEFSPKNSSQPFRFSIRAIDKFNRKSDVKSYSR